MTIHSPDNIRIRSRYSLSRYCDENQIDISEFGDLRFFYNPRYLPYVEPTPMKRTLKRLEGKRNVTNNQTKYWKTSNNCSLNQVLNLTGIENHNSYCQLCSNGTANNSISMEVPGSFHQEVVKVKFEPIEIKEEIKLETFQEFEAREQEGIDFITSNGFDQIHTKSDIANKEEPSG